MNKKNSLLNVGVAVGFKIIILVGSILVRRFLIMYLGNEVNGLDALYISIVGFLSVAELGIGSAIVFCMYKPIVDRDLNKVAALYHFISKAYKIIGGIILGLGLCVMPFLPTLAKDYSINLTELYITYLMMLISVVITYMFSARISLLEAYKNNYIATTITSVSYIIRDILMIVSVIVFRSFYAYLACRIIASLLQWLMAEVVTNRKYKDVIQIPARVDKETSGYIAKNVKAMCMHKIGSILVNTVDSIIISSFIGVVVLGYYSNYVTIMTSMTALLVLFFTSLTSIIGHEFAKDNEELIRIFNFFHVFNFVMGVVFFLGYYAVIDNLIALFYGENLLCARSITYIITFNYFIQFMRNAVVLFRDATGTFYYDRWKAIIEGFVNIILSVVFVLVFPEEFKVVGVIAATIITNLLISHIVEPFVLFRHGIRKSLKSYYLENYIMIAVFGGLLFGLEQIMVSTGSQWLSLLANGGIAIGIGILVFAFFIACYKDFRFYVKKLLFR